MISRLGVLQMPHTSSSWRVFLFGVLCAAATALPTLALLTAFGTIGLLIAVLLTTIFGVPSSGGPYPFQMLPDFFHFLGTWLPLRYETDGMRSLIFFGGRSAAGLGAALWVLGAWAIGSIIVGGVIAWGFDRSRQRTDGSRQLSVASSQ